MLDVHFSPRSEELLAVLAQHLKQAPTSLWGPPTTILVPHANTQRYVELGIAQSLGIAANLQFRGINLFLHEWLRETLPTERLLDHNALHGQILNTLFDPTFLELPLTQPIVRYLEAGGVGIYAREKRVAQLAQTLTEIFEGYIHSQPELLHLWKNSKISSEIDLQPTQAWQSALWNQILKQNNLTKSKPWLPLNEALAMVPTPAVAAKKNLYVFGYSYLSPLQYRALQTLSHYFLIRFFAFNPCLEFWEDVKRPGSSHTPIEEIDPLPLALWGKPGREHVQTMTEMTEGNISFHGHEAVQNQTSCLLHQIQQDIAFRAATPGAAPRWAQDTSIQLTACKDVRSEVEHVAKTIWQWIRAKDAPAQHALRYFDDVVVLIPPASFEHYLPHLETVFQEAQHIPFHIKDAPLRTLNPLADAAMLLLELPLHAQRERMLQVLCHPALWGQELYNPSQFISLIDRFGVFDSTRAEDVEAASETPPFSWEQCLRRLVLSSFVLPSKDDATVLFETPDQTYHLESFTLESAHSWTFLVRSLLEDIHHARTTRTTLSGWIRFVEAYLKSYLIAQTSLETRDLQRIVAELHTLEGLTLESTRISYGLFFELAQAKLRSLRRDKYFNDGPHTRAGVTVSTLTPMRTIPFEAVFVLGLNETSFPTQERQQVFDLRNHLPRKLDVRPAERDAYTFLELLLGTRNQLTLSYVSHDSSGNARLPSPLLSQLKHILQSQYAASQDYTDTSRSEPPIEESKSLSVAVHSTLSKEVSLPNNAHALRISAYTLRRFLENPWLGWLDRLFSPAEDAESLIHYTSEPFEAHFATRTQVLKTVFLDSLRSPHALEKIYQQHTQRAVAQGLWPVAWAGAVTKHKDIKLLESWLSFGHLEEEHFAENQDSKTTYTRFVLGAEKKESQNETRVAPLRLWLESSAETGTAKVAVDIVGRTEIVSAQGTGLIASFQDLDNKINVTRYALRGFLSQVIGVASGILPETNMHWLGLSATLGSPAKTATIRRIAQQEAYLWLVHLAQDLLKPASFVDLSFDTIARAAEAWPALNIAKLGLPSSQTPWTDDEERKKQYMPLRVQDENQTSEIVQRRFALFFDRLQTENSQ